MKPKPLPPQDVLKEIFDYDPETGVLRKKRTGKVCGSVGLRGYLSVCIEYEHYAVHRIVWKMYYGYDPSELDHVNRIKTDNSIANLRESDRVKNSRNRGRSSRNTSGHTGVQKIGSRWRSMISGKYIGTYVTRKEAIEQRKKAEEQYGYG